jgi:hypothetical protein
LIGAETVLATIQRVTEGRTKPNWKHVNGQRRFEIDAVPVADPTGFVWCSTLDPLRASLCQRARETGRPVVLTIRMVTLHGRFGSRAKVFNLVDVSFVQSQVSA